MIYHLIQIRSSHITKNENYQCGQRCRENFTDDGNVNDPPFFFNSMWPLLKKLKNELSYNLAIHFSSPRIQKLLKKSISTFTFIAVAKIWKQLKCPKTYNKLWYIYIYIFYIYACKFVYVYMCLKLCIYVYIHKCIYVSVHIYLCIHIL